MNERDWVIYSVSCYTWFHNSLFARTAVKGDQMKAKEVLVQSSYSFMFSSNSQGFILICQIRIEAMQLELRCSRRYLHL